MSRSRLADPVVALLQSLGVVVLLAAAGAVGGIVWSRLWDAPSGVVRSGQWLTDETGLRADFSGTAYYVVVAAIAGLACGVLVGLLLARWEVLTLVVLLVASALAGWLMWRIGLERSPADPEILARTAADGTRLPGDLHVSGRPPFVAFPLGAILGYTVLLISVSKRGVDADGSRREPEREPEPDESSEPAFLPPSPG